MRSLARSQLFCLWTDSSTENLFCAGTYKKILDHIAAPALACADIKYDTVVRGVQWQVEDSEQIQVTLQSGQTLLYDEVVVTSPLGWLKRHPDAFEPALPSRLTQAINSIGYGCLEKVLIIVILRRLPCSTKCLLIFCRYMLRFPKHSGKEIPTVAASQMVLFNGYLPTTRWSRTPENGAKRQSSSPTCLKRTPIQLFCFTYTASSPNI